MIEENVKTTVDGCELISVDDTCLFYIEVTYVSEIGSPHTPTMEYEKVKVIALLIAPGRCSFPTGSPQRPPRLFANDSR